jgi:3-phenylpropionate/trans-cinnamate dioxygenase ferredoxin reductase component
VADRPFVIAGASLAGLRAAKAMRAAGEDGPIVVVGEEPHLPYTRPPLSKGVLKGTEEPESADLGGGELDVEWRLGERVESVDPAAHEVVLGGGERIPYRRLLVATGSRPREWPGEGAGLEGLVTLRTLDDAVALRARFAQGPRVVTIGAGFIGCEVAASARALGLDVTVIDIAELPMATFGRDIGSWVADLHRSHGVDLRLGSGVAAIEGEGRVEAVVLEDGSRIEADVAVVALGAVPETGLLEDSGLEIGPGLRCDETLTSVSDPDVLGAGDVASWPHPQAQGDMLRVEHWQNAVEGGRVAGRNLLLDPDERKAYDSLPSMWSDQYDLRIQVAGLPAGADGSHVLEAEPGGHRRVVACSRDGRVCAAIAVAAPRRLAWYREHVERGSHVDEVRSALKDQDDAIGPPAQAVSA